MARRGASWRAYQACVWASWGSSSSARPAVTRCMATLSASEAGRLRSSARASRSRSFGETSAASSGSRSRGPRGRSSSFDLGGRDGRSPSRRGCWPPSRRGGWPRSRRGGGGVIHFLPGRETTKGPPMSEGLWSKNVRRRPTLPPRHQGSTIGAEGLSFRVRNGTGRFPFAILPPKLYGVVASSRGRDEPTAARELHSGRVASLWSSPRPISTGQLHALPHFHFRPINPLVSWGPYQVDPVGDLILKRASRLDAFSGYPFRT